MKNISENTNKVRGERRGANLELVVIAVIGFECIEASMLLNRKKSLNCAYYKDKIKQVRFFVLLTWTCLDIVSCNNRHETRVQNITKCP